MKQFLIVLHVVLLYSPLLFSQERWDFLWEGNARDCYVYLPQSRGAQAGLPVVFNLYGYGGSSNEARTYHHSHILGDSVGFITIYPDAFDKRWNSGLGDNPGWPTPNVDDVGFISLIIDSLISKYKIDTSRVYVCGNSNGGFMSLKLAGLLGNRIASAASVSGVLTNSTAASYNTTRPVPVLTINGTSDNLLPYYGGKTGLFSVDSTIEFLRNKSFCFLPAEMLSIPDINPNDQSTVVKYIFRSSTNTSQVVHYRIIGGGHEWPGSPTYNGATVINRDIDAITEIWNFFKQFPAINTRFTVSSNNAKLNQSYYRPGMDSIYLNVTVSNPLKHETKLTALIDYVSGLRYDSVSLYNDGLHRDGNPGDSIWGCRFLAPSAENRFTVNIRTDDLTEGGTYHILPQPKYFFTNGPVKFINAVFTSTDTIPNPGDIFRLKFRLGNIGTVDTVRNVGTTVATMDTMISLGITSTIFYGNLPPGKDSLGVFRQEVKINPQCPSTTTVRLLLTISSEGIPAWTDTVSIRIQPTGVGIPDTKLPTDFSLEQNYPNPFNPSTTIRYSLPSSANVKLSVYDLLGREIATLLNEVQSAGWKEVPWNASGFSSGIYFYKLQAGSYVGVKKLMLLK